MRSKAKPTRANERPKPVEDQYHSNPSARSTEAWIKLRSDELRLVDKERRAAGDTDAMAATFRRYGECGLLALDGVKQLLIELKGGTPEELIVFLASADVKVIWPEKAAQNAKTLRK
jgi:hypothetical protein